VLFENYKAQRVIFILLFMLLLMFSSLACWLPYLATLNKEVTNIIASYSFIESIYYLCFSFDVNRSGQQSVCFPSSQRMKCKKLNPFRNLSKHTSSKGNCEEGMEIQIMNHFIKNYSEIINYESHWGF